MKNILLILLLMTSWQVAASRGLTVSVKQSEAANAEAGGEMQFYTNSFALVIGIDDYTNGWPRLSKAISDAELISATLEKKGFEVSLLKNLNSNELEQAFEDFFIEKGQDPEARLFVWYAGHGHTVNGEGYLIPADGTLEQDKTNFLRRSLSMRRFGEFVRLAESKHVYTVFDSCFAGTIFSVARSAPSPAITRVTSRPVRQFLSSGDAGQTVSDDGMFARLFSEALMGERRSDLNNDGYLTADEIGSFITTRISNYTNNKQVPRHGKLRDPNYDRGDFVFLASLPEPIPGNQGPGNQGLSNLSPGKPLGDSILMVDYEEPAYMFSVVRSSKRDLPLMTASGYKELMGIRVDMKSDPQLALSKIERLVQRQKLNALEQAQIWMELGYVFQQQDGGHLTAIDIYVSALNLGVMPLKTETWLLNALAEIYDTHGQPGAALAHFERIEALNQSEADYQDGLKRLAVVPKKPAEIFVIPSYLKKSVNKRARKLSAVDAATAKVMHAASSLFASDPEESLRLLNTLIDGKPISAYAESQVWNFIAYAHFAMEDNESTIEAYQRVLTTGETSIKIEVTALKNLAQLYLINDQNKAALAHIIRAEAYTPTEEILKIKNNVEVMILYSQDSVD